MKPNLVPPSHSSRVQPTVPGEWGGGRESTSDKMAPPELAEWGARTTFRWTPQPWCLAPPTYRYAQELLRGRGTTRTLDGGEGRLEGAGVTFPKIRRASSELPGST